MGLSNMLSKLFKKEGQESLEDNPIRYKDFDTIIPPPQPKTRGILVYKTMNLGLESFSKEGGRVASLKAIPNDGHNEELLVLEELVEEVEESDTDESNNEAVEDFDD